MSSEPSAYILTFRSSEEAIGAELALRAARSGEAAYAASGQAALASLSEDLIPVPRGISSQCGFCLLLGPASPRAPSFDAGVLDEAPIAAFAAARRCEGLYRVREHPIPGKKRREKSYERIDIDEGR